MSRSPLLPPRLAERVLELLLGPGRASRFIVGDLREEFAARSADQSRSAVLWYCLEVLKVGVRLKLARRHQPPVSRFPLPAPRSRRTQGGKNMRSELRL